MIAEPAQPREVLGAPPSVRASIQANRLRSGVPGVTIVKEGLIPPARRTAPPPAPLIYYGGVYTAEREICEPSLLERHWGRPTVPYDPAAMDLRDLEKSPGTAVYGGMLLGDFGHFLVESTARLWWVIAEAFSGPVVFQAERDGLLDLPFIRRFFELLGIDKQIVVATYPIQFSEVVVPHVSFKFQTFVYPSFRAPFVRVAGNIRRGSAPAEVSRIYFSRTRLPHRRALGEDVIEDAFRREGYAIVHPQTLAFDQQIQCALEAKKLAGVVGSALHLILFSMHLEKVIYLIRSADVSENFPMVDEVVGSSSLYIYAAQAADGPIPWAGPYLLDTPRTLDLLKGAAILTG